jgi:serine/threonine-protein kinase
MIIQKAMAKRPQDRYDSMVELDEALSAWEPAGDAPLAAAPRGTMRSTGPDLTRVSSLHKQVRTVAMARPMILILGALGTFWGAGGLILSITAVLRMIKGGGARDNLEAGEAILLVLGVVFTLLTPLILAIRYLARSVWGNSVKAVELSDALRGPVLVGLSGYGFASLLVRLIEAVFLRHAVGVAWPTWDILLFVVGAVAAGGAFFVGVAEKPRG